MTRQEKVVNSTQSPEHKTTGTSPEDIESWKECQPDNWPETAFAGEDIGRARSPSLACLVHVPLFNGPWSKGRLAGRPRESGALERIENGEK